MHGCVSQTDRTGKKRSNAIDRILEEDKRKAKGECKILILGRSLPFFLSTGADACPAVSPGPRESGKTTIVNQMRILHQHGFSDAELAAYRLAIHKNVLDSANAVVVHMKKLGLDCVDFENRVSLCSIFSASFAIWCDFPLCSFNFGRLYTDHVITCSIYHPFSAPAPSRYNSRLPLGSPEPPSQFVA
jgi:hypothetical protein